MVNTKFILRCQRRIPLGAGKAWKPPSYTLSFPTDLPRGGFPPPRSSYPPAYSEATVESSFFGSHPFGKRVHRENGLPSSLGPWYPGMFLFMLMGSMLSSGEMRGQTVIVLTHLCLKIRMGWGSAGWETGCVRGRKGVLLDGNCGERGWMSVMRWWLSVLSTSLGFCNHIKNFAGR